MTATRRALRIAIVNPRFSPSFWGHDFALPLVPGDKRCWTATGSLPLLAALVPPGHTVDLIDENIEPLDLRSPGRLEQYDVIGVTGMMVQRDRMFEILAALADLPAVICAGGPFVSVSPDSFAGRADVLFVGEAEETWPAYLAALAAGEPTAARYEQAAKTDMTRVPTPRYDLLAARHYVSAPVQFSRGCPFLCEFCDIITIFGRRPRLKTPAQLLAELDAVRLAGFRSCFLVDDNFIGNRQAAKQLLHEVIAWQRRHGYPLQFNTEASIDLADLPDLIDLMVEANILQVFVGIESPRRGSLEETRKTQNVRGDSLLAKIARIRDGGLVIQAGFIVGFDNDDAAIFDEQFAFIQEAGLAQALTSILSPIPTTPLHARLAAEGRLDDTEADIGFLPRQMTRAQLRSGHNALVRRLFEPAAYFERLFRGYRGSPAFRERRARLARSIGRKASWRQRVRQCAATAVTAMRLLAATVRSGHLKTVGAAYLRAYLKENRPLGRERIPPGSFMTLCVLHWHYFRMAGDHRNTAFGMVGKEPPAGRRMKDFATGAAR